MSKKDETQSTAITRTPEEKLVARQQVAQEIEGIVSECGMLAIRGQAPLVQALQLADGIQRMREVLSLAVVEKYFMPLQGSPLGFVTDRDNPKDGQSPGYPVAIVRDVAIEAFMRGFRPIGNEVNIIAGRFYAAKAGFERVVSEFTGLTELRYELGVPESGPNGTSLVSFDASWKLHGIDDVMSGRPAKDGSIDSRIIVRMNAGMGPDAALGKATRKLFARIYVRLTGCSRDIEADPKDYIEASGATVPTAMNGAAGQRMSLRRDAQPPPAEPMREPGQEG
jgi:hypothetical protein